MEYLDFEIGIKELEDQYKTCAVLKEEGLDMKDVCEKLEKKIFDEKEKLYNNLTPWQIVQLSRHPQRPYTLDYINYLSNDSFIELHGDRHFSDDKAMVGGICKIDGLSVVILGQQKGRNTKERQIRRFGMPNPDGYRKALRLMKLAEKFDIPIVTLMDTPGAYPGIEAEERGQGEAIAKNIYEMARIKVPIISIVIGEGASGGALGIGVGNKVLMMENTWYSVISPESCSSILWRSWDYKEKAAEVLKLTPKDMLSLGIIDDIIKEPLGGAHQKPEIAFENVKNAILTHIKELNKLGKEELVKARQNKFIAMGFYEG
ncbi:MAG: acetyl-CoA carboxylase carboxyltransferase subunit alpha [Solirubrobacteraceae bacterium]